MALLLRWTTMRGVQLARWWLKSRRVWHVKPMFERLRWWSTSVLLRYYLNNSRNILACKLSS